MAYQNLKIIGHFGTGETRSEALTLKLDGLIVDHDDLYAILDCFSNAFPYDPLEITVSFDTTNE